MNPEDIIKYHSSTEKGLELTKNENVLIFIVNTDANKKQIKEAMEKFLKVKVVKVNTFINQGVKKAYVKLHPSNKAIDIENKLSG